MASGNVSTDTLFKGGADNVLPTINPTGVGGNAATYMNGGKRQKKQQGGALAFSELKGGKRSRKQQQEKLQEGGALAFTELKGGAALTPADFKGGDASADLPKQSGGKRTSKKRRSAKKSHKRKSTTVKSLVKGLFGLFKKQ